MLIHKKGPYSSYLRCSCRRSRINQRIWSINYYLHGGRLASPNCLGGFEVLNKILNLS
jgi:hypothetical protein